MRNDKELKHTGNLAEIIGIMMGDGCIHLDRLNKYQTSVSFHKEEKNYLYYVKKKFEHLFNYKFCISELKSEFLLRNTSIYVGKQLILCGLRSGNKVKNKLTIPTWIFEKRYFLLNFVRGFFDTDGCIYRKYGNYAQVQFKLGCEEMLISLRMALVKLHFNPTKIKKEICKTPQVHVAWKFYLSRQKEIDIFFRDIKPMNEKHLFRYKKIRNGDVGI